MITDNIIDPVLLRASRVAQQQFPSPLTFNTLHNCPNSEPDLGKGAKSDAGLTPHVTQTVFPAGTSRSQWPSRKQNAAPMPSNTLDNPPNAEPDATEGAKSDASLMPHVPQVVVPAATPTLKIPSTHQHSTQLLFNILDRHIYAEPHSGNSANANLALMPNVLKVVLPAITPGPQQPATQQTVNTANNLALKEACKYIVTGKREHQPLRPR